MEATYFIEAFKNGKKKNLLMGGIQKIGFLETALKNTRVSADLETIAIFKIKPKSQEVIDNYERMLKEKSGAVN